MNRPLQRWGNNWYLHHSLMMRLATYLHTYSMCIITQRSAVQCSAVQCSTVQCSAQQFSAVQCSAVQYSARWTWPWPSSISPRYITGLHRELCTVLHCTELHKWSLHETGMHCNVLHLTVRHCTVLHITVLHSAALHCTADIPWLTFNRGCQDF